MMLIRTFVVFLVGSFSLAHSQSAGAGGPLLNSWHIEFSGQYARIYRSFEDEQSGAAQTTWANEEYNQALPVYGGVQKIQHSDQFVYVTITGLASGHVMGPWYIERFGNVEEFPNWPEAVYSIFKIPSQPIIPEAKTRIPGGSIGVMIDGTVIFSSSDAFSWDGETGADTGPGATTTGFGSGIWSHDAYITESETFDRSNAHSAGNELHYHASPIKVRHLLGDSIEAIQQADGSTAYVEHFNGRHSPILGWLSDGLPLYGPFGYSHPTDPDSAVRRMITGFTPRNGQNGSYDIPASGRNRLPDWAARVQGIGPEVSGEQAGPSNDIIAVPYFMEDYDYKGDLDGYSLYAGDGEFDPSRHFDLNEYNVRWCVTPEFPDGVWAYFTATDDMGNPTFPYNVAAQFYGDPSRGGRIDGISEPVTTHWEGGAATELDMKIGSDTDTVTLTWSAVEGGRYEVESTSDLSAPSWTVEGSGIDATMNLGQFESQSDGMNRFFKVRRTELADYDAVGTTLKNAGDGGGGDGGGNGGGGPAVDTVSPDSAALGSSVTVSMTLGGMAPPAEVKPTAVEIGSVAAESFEYDGTTITATFTFPSGVAGAQDVAVTFPPPPGANGSVVFRKANGFTID